MNYIGISMPYKQKKYKWKQQDKIRLLALYKRT